MYSITVQGNDYKFYTYLFSTQEAQDKFYNEMVRLYGTDKIIKPAMTIVAEV